MQDSWTGKLQKEGAIRYRGNYEETMPNHLSREPLGGSQASKNAKERRREPGGIQIQCEAYIQTLWLMRCNEIDRVSAELSHSNIFEPCLDWKTRLCCKGGGGPCWAVSCHWAVIELSLSCMSWGLVAQFPFMKRTFVLARRGKAQSEDISAVRQSFWDYFWFFFLFSQCHKWWHILHHCSVTMSLFCAVVSPALVSKSPPWTVLHLSFA